MGNKLNTRRRSTADTGDDVSRRRRRKPARSQSTSQVDGRSNRISMPELGGAVPYKGQDESDVNIKVYRSYGDLARPKASTLDRPDYRVYRKSTEGLQKYASLPRHFGRSKSAMDVPNGTLRDDVRRRRDLPYNPDYPEIMPRRRSPPDSVSSHSSLRAESQRTSKRVSAASSVSSLAKAPVTQDDFPSTEQIKRKLSCFENQFARSLADKYAGLADTLQLSALPIALSRDPEGRYGHIKLLDYLQGETIPLDLLSENPERYIMLMPDALFHGIMHVRRDRISDLELWTTLARDLVTCVGVEAGNELTRMFEYQIGLLTGETAVRVLADHAAACVIDYIKRYSSFLDRNTAILGVLRGYPDQLMTGSPKYLSVILGNRELKWDVQDVLKRPGLRKELLLFSSTVSDPDDLYNPWRYYTNKNCDPQLFGYRGLVVEWDWIRGTYRLNEEDMANFGDDISDPISYPDDFHRLYSPYKVLIGEDVMTRYGTLKAQNKTADSLAQFVNDLTGGDRDEIRPVYRPLVATPPGLNFHTMKLDNADLSRARLRDSDLSQASLNNCTLLLTDLEGAKFRNPSGQNTPLRGTDMSYTNLVGTTLDQATLDGVTAKHVVVAKANKKPPARIRNRPGEHHSGSALDETDSTPVTSKSTKKVRKVPKSLDIQMETNGQRETLIDGDLGADPEDRRNYDVRSPDTEETCCVSDSRGNLLNIEQASSGDNKKQGNVKTVKKKRKPVSNTGLTKDTGVGQPATEPYLIEQKQKKIRERKKKTKKRSVSPLASTPTEPIPETTVIVQEQVVVANVQGQRPVKGGDQLPPRTEQEVVLDPTEEFFKESQPQYQPGHYQASPQYAVRVGSTGRPIREDLPRTNGNQEGLQPTNGYQEAARDVTDGGVTRRKVLGDVQREGTPEKSPSEATREVVKAKGKKKGKKGETVKAYKSKSGEKKRKKSRAKSSEREAASASESTQEVNGDKSYLNKTPVNGASSPDRPNSTSPNDFRAIDATPFEQKSPGKALSTTNIHQHRGGPIVQDHSRSRREDILRPRMTKSLSHHGNLTSEESKIHNLSLDSYALGLRTARQIYGLSKEEIEYITRSQIFDMIKGLQVENIQSNLPEIDGDFIGREQERDDVTDLLSSPGRIVTVTGCYGNGKSALATSVGHEISKKFVVPIVVDVRGCLTADSVARRLTSTFGLQFGYKDLGYFYSWINCHEQRFLFIVDNLDIGPEEDSKLSDMMDSLISYVKESRILCLCRRNFFKGSSPHEVYRLGDARRFGTELLQKLLPDLHEEGMDGLLETCVYNCYMLRLVSKAFFIDEVDSGKLFEDLMECQEHALLDRVEMALDGLAYDEGERDVLRRLACCVLIILDNIPLDYAELLQKASHSPASFDAKTVATLAERKDVTSVKGSLDELTKTGFIIAATGDRYYLPSLIRLVNQCKLSDNGAETMEYCKNTLENVKLLCAMYHSKQCEQAVNDFREDFDRYVDVFSKVIQREDTYEMCPSFASLDYALFLGELLPEETYLNFYESFAQESENRNDLLKECRALCCLSHRLLSEESISAAKHAVDRAYELVHALPDSTSERAFCLRCMGQIVWQEAEDRNRALILVKKSLDFFKEAHGSRDLQTLHTNELYAQMLTRKERYQTARHFYNISDLFVTETMNAHPLLIEGYDCRRIIWDGLCLFQRAIEMAKKAAEVSKTFLGEHPTTARMMSNLCDAIIKRGVLQDAIRAGIEALSIRSKVLGDHQETGESYKKLAYLMLRSGQYDEAARFAQSAVDVFEKVRAPETLKIDARNVMAQARLRLDYKSHVFVELQGRDASKKNLHSDSDELNMSKASTVVSTEV